VTVIKSIYQTKQSYFNEQHKSTVICLIDTVNVSKKSIDKGYN
jgi:hypothetical protein